MRKIGFIGAYDKTDFLLYISKILVELGQRVLLVDGTIMQKARYIVPTIEPSRTYVTEFEGIDIAVGLKTIEDIKGYLGIPLAEELPYDIALIDTDTAGSVMNFKIENSEKIYFTTSFDMYSIRRGIESISGVQTKVVATKVLFTKHATKEENDYLNFLSKDSNIEWNNEIIFLPFELGDQTVIYKNQRVAKIKLKGLTTQYKEGLIYIVGDIIGQENYPIIKKAFKKIEKGI
mgnify:CR=1 FL=1